MASFHNWTGDEEIATQVPQLLNADNAATREILDDKFNKTSEIVGASDLNSFRDEGFYCCNSNAHAETILNCPTNYAFGLMVWGKDAIVYQEVREFNRGSNQNYNNCWRRSYYIESGQSVWSNWQQMSYAATTLAGYGITDGMSKTAQNSVSTENVMKRNVTNSSLRLMGGTGAGSGASLQLCGSALTGTEGQFSLMAVDSTQSVALTGNPSGQLTWNNKNIVRSINNVVADANGNVNITVSGGGGSGGGSGNYLPLTGGTVTGGIIAQNFQTGTGESNYFQCRKFRGEGNANSYYHAIDFGYSGHDSVDFYEYDPNWNFYSCTTGNKSGAVLVGKINSNGWNGGAVLSGTPTAPTAATGTNTTQIATTAFVQKSLGGYVKTVNNTAPDSNGNVTITVGGSGSGGSNITVDTTLSSTSDNPIANKAVYAAVNNKLDKTGIAAYSYRDAKGNIIADTYAKASDISQTYATKAEVSGVVKSVNGTKPDSSGNVSLTVSGGSGASLSTENTWTAKQTFQKMKFSFESFATSRISGAYDSPSKSVAVYNITDALVLDMSTLTGMLTNGESTLFTAYIASNASYSLSITNAGTLKYVGSASDLSITNSGLLLNVLLTKNTNGAVTSIAQASKLS